MYVTSGRLMNFSSDTSALSSHFLDQACVRNPFKNPSRIIFILNMIAVRHLGNTVDLNGSGFATYSRKIKAAKLSLQTEMLWSMCCESCLFNGQHEVLQIFSAMLKWK